MKRAIIKNENINKELIIEIWNKEDAAKSSESMSVLENANDISEESNIDTSNISKLIFYDNKVYAVEMAATLDKHNFKTPNFNNFHIHPLELFIKSLNKLDLLKAKQKNGKTYYENKVIELISILNEGSTHKRIKLLTNAERVNVLKGYFCQLYKWDVTDASQNNNRAGRIIYTVLEQFNLIIFCVIYVKNKKIDLTQGDEEYIFKLIKQYLLSKKLIQ